MCQYEQALAAYDEAIQLCKMQGLPIFPEIALNRGSVFDYLGRFDDALSSYAEAKRLRHEQGLPDDPIIAMNRGNVFTTLERYDEAFAEYSEAQRLRKLQGLPADPLLTVSIGLLYYELERYVEALDSFAEADHIVKDQKFLPMPIILRSRGEVYHKLGLVKEASLAYEEAQQIIVLHGLPDDELLAELTGNLCLDQGRCNDALVHFISSERISRDQGIPIEPSLCFSFARCYFQLGMFSEAVLWSRLVDEYCGAVRFRNSDQFDQFKQQLADEVQRISRLK
jgi:tetratricopeptide (TPR) repeat protein